jgi:hypothetical protein
MERGMNRADDRSYYAERAKQERTRANVCEDNAVALVHFKLADAYEQRVQQVGQNDD